MTDAEKQLAPIAAHVSQLFKLYFNPALLYHNLEHTQGVVKHAKEMAEFYSLDSDAYFVLMSAAWFHDTGHLFHAAKDHEAISIMAMRDYFDHKQLPSAMIDKIAACIEATRFPSAPVDITAHILCDADLYHLGTSEFITANELVKEELQLREKTCFPNWNEMSLLFLKSHHYFTDYCQHLLNEGKAGNVKQLEQLTVSSLP